MQSIEDQISKLDPNIRKSNSLDMKKVKQEINANLNDLKCRIGERETSDEAIILFVVGSLLVSTTTEVLSDSITTEIDGFWCVISPSTLDVYILEEKAHKIPIDANKKQRGARQLRNCLKELGCCKPANISCKENGEVVDNRKSFVTCAHISQAFNPN